LIPVPPLDGFGMIAPYLSPELRVKLSTPPMSSYLFFGYFMLLWMAPGFLGAIYRGMYQIMGRELFVRGIGGMSGTFH